ncbi:MAG: hypothetical protein NXI31_04790 [bacterium]|nr:hypothetical protein [bacterium]
MSGDDPIDPIALLREHAPWLFAPELHACIVGSFALQLACERAGIDGPNPRDLDLAWSLDPAAGQALLEEHGAFLASTVGNLERGTVAASIGGQRLEITTFRGGGAATGLRFTERLTADIAERDMTIGGLAVALADGSIHDPHDGLRDWREQRIAPIGDPADRVREHPVRWLRYFRKAHVLGFILDGRVRSLTLDRSLLHELPPEAVAGELRAILLDCESPGRCLLELHEAGLLTTLAPELARQFDGRPAGPQRWHPEVSQALHLILALEWAVSRTRGLSERDRLATVLAVLTHDLGKGDTKPDEWPSHRGHEGSGLPHVDSLLDRWPGLTDARTRTLCRHVCELHLLVRNFDELKAGTLARHYDRWFRPKDYPVALFALAVAADSAGRLGLAHTGKAVEERVRSQLEWLRSTCAAVDAGAIRAAHPDDLEAFRAALHEARARAIHASRGARP